MLTSTVVIFPLDRWPPADAGSSGSGRRRTPFLGGAVRWPARYPGGPRPLSGPVFVAEAAAPPLYTLCLSLATGLLRLAALHWLLRDHCCCNRGVAATVVSARAPCFVLLAYIRIYSYIFTSHLLVAMKRGFRDASTPSDLDSDPETTRTRQRRRTQRPSYFDDYEDPSLAKGADLRAPRRRRVPPADVNSGGILDLPALSSPGSRRGRAAARIQKPLSGAFGSFAFGTPGMAANASKSAPTPAPAPPTGVPLPTSTDGSKQGSARSVENLSLLLVFHRLIA